ncbi:MAG: hypothetical protein FWG80_04285 [Alphaproteobacteria bacterium]|nr:hypothetical protein [Alphaproteobacteria bacterium]
MNKYFLLLAICPVLITGCGSWVKPAPGSEALVRIDAEPIGCNFLYKIDSEVTAYKESDAEQYLRNRIVDRLQGGNVYWVISQRTRPNDGNIVSPRQSFLLTANVYDCPDPNNVQTRKQTASVSTFNTAQQNRVVYGGI